MGKLQLLQVVLVTCCVLLYNTSEAIKNEGKFKEVMENKVIPKFRGWTLKYGPNSNQFAVMLLMNSDKDWNSFEFIPDFKQEINNRYIQPDISDAKLVNYFAAMPRKGQHSELRVLNRFNDLLKGYKKKHNVNPKAVVLYTYNLPCYERDFTKKKYSACTTYLTQFFKKEFQRKKAVLKGVEFIVSYTKSDGKFEACKCNIEGTEKKFKEAGIIDFVHVPYQDPQSWFHTFKSNIWDWITSWEQLQQSERE